MAGPPVDTNVLQQAEKEIQRLRAELRKAKEQAMRASVRASENDVGIYDKKQDYESINQFVRGQKKSSNMTSSHFYSYPFTLFVQSIFFFCDVLVCNPVKTIVYHLFVILFFLGCQIPILFLSLSSLCFV